MTSDLTFPSFAWNYRVGLLKGGKVPPREATLESLNLSSPVSIMIIGSAAASVKEVAEKTDVYAAFELKEQIGTAYFMCLLRHHLHFSQNQRSASVLNAVVSPRFPSQI